MTFTKTYAISRMEKGASLVGSIFGPALAIFGMSLFLMSYAATHAWQIGASQMGYFWQSVGEYPYFVQAIWPTLTSFWQTSALTLVMLVLGLGGAYLTFSDFKRRKWVRGAFRLALSMLAVAFVIFAMSSSVVLAASPTSGPIGQSVDTGYGTSCSASFCVFTNTVSGTQYYYAMVGLGYSSGSSCALTAGCQVGQIAFGGPGNAGGATGTSAQSIIQSVCTNLDTTSPYGGTVSVGSGVFIFSGEVQCNGDISLLGEGQPYDSSSSTVFQIANNANPSELLFFPNGRMAISNLVINVNQANGNTASHALYIGSGSSGPSDITDVTFMNYDASAIADANTGGTTIERSIFLNAATTTSAAIDSSGTDTIVSMNYISGGYGLYLHGSNQSALDNTIIATGIDAGQASAIIIEGNHLVGSGAPTSIYGPEDAGSYFAISGNVITDGTISTKITSAYTNGETQSVISNNVIYATTSASTFSTLFGIEIYGHSNILVSGNQIYNFSGSSQGGIYIAQGNLVTPSHLLIIGNSLLNDTVAIDFNTSPTSSEIISNQGYNPVATSSVTAGASVWTYTNNDGYDEVMQLSTAGGISAETCNGVSGWSITVGTSSCTLPPGGTMVVTWATTAPVYEKVPLFA